MNVNGLIKNLEFQIDLQDLKTFGLSEKEIEGFLEFEWDWHGKDLILSEENIGAQH